jgi:lysophospholipase L1-like esterase
MRIQSASNLASILSAALLVTVGCSNSTGTNPTNLDSGATGGATTSATGGAANTGGVAETGGSASTGGVTSSGGATGVGGAVATGGAVRSGGSTSSRGGSATGGTFSTGGTPQAGGSTSAGGATAQGGAASTGGARLDAGPDTRDSGAPELPAAPIDALGGTASGTVYIAGDSTVSVYTNSPIHQAGWGQMLATYFNANAKILDKAVGGMTARHYIEAGYLDQITAVMKAGDYLLVQFGTNDSNTTATYTLPGSTTPIPYYLAPETDFKTYLTQYVDATKAKGGTTVFVTPPPRHSCSGTNLGVANGLAAYATAMKELGATLGVPVDDLNGKTVAYLSTVACDVSGSTFYLVNADGTTDGTHFQENGANVMAGLVATGIRELGLPLATFLK